MQGKIWGCTESIFNDDHVEIHRIEANKGGYSSFHIHKYKYNLFYVESGKLKISVKKNEYDLTDETVISKGQKTVVKPGEYHKFEALENTIAYEIYYVKLLPSDISRENSGGKNG